MSVFYICIDPPRNSPVYRELKAHYDKVGVKAGSLSWYVRERDMKKRKLAMLGERALSVRTTGVPATFKKIREAFQSPNDRTR